MALTREQIVDIGRRLQMLRGELETQLRVTAAGDARRAPLVTPVDLQLREVEQRKRLQLVAEALERLEKQAYGLCGQCGAEIDYEHLVETPEAAFCASCQLHRGAAHPL